MDTIHCTHCDGTGRSRVKDDIYDSGFLSCGVCHGVGRLRADGRTWSECVVCDGVGLSYQHDTGYTCGNGHSWKPPYLNN